MAELGRMTAQELVGNALMEARSRRSAAPATALARSAKIAIPCNDCNPVIAGIEGLGR